MSDSFEIDFSPTVFKWLEESISLLDQDEKKHTNALGSTVYLLTLGFTIITIPCDICIGAVESIFQLVYYQDISRALLVLRRKWIEAVVQETAFIIIGIVSYGIDLGNWQRSYRVTKYFIQQASEHCYLGSPQIFNCIRYPIPKNGHPMPASCNTQAERLFFSDFNTKWSEFSKLLREFKRSHKNISLQIYGANNVIQRIQSAKTATEVMALNPDYLKPQDIRKRLEDEEKIFAANLAIQAIRDILKVTRSAHDVLLSYLNLPVHIRKNINVP